MTRLTMNQLRAQIEEMLEEPVTIGEDDNLIDIGLDSMRAMNLAMRWDEAGVPLDFTDLAEAPTLRELWTMLEARQP